MIERSHGPQNVCRWETSFTTPPLIPSRSLPTYGPRLAERDETVEQQTATAGVLQSLIPRPAISRARVGQMPGQGDAPVREVVAQVLDERDLSGRVESV